MLLFCDVMLVDAVELRELTSIPMWPSLISAYSGFRKVSNSTAMIPAVWFQYLDSLGRMPKAPPLLSAAGIPDSGGTRKKASPSPLKPPPTGFKLKWKVVVKLAISPLALSHSRIASTYCDRPAVHVMSFVR